MITLSEIRQTCHAGKAKKLANESMLQRSYLWNREVGGWLTFLFLNFLPFVRPNHVSILMVLVGFAGCLYFSVGTTSSLMVGVMLLYLSFLLDKVDGDIARYRKCFSSFGKFLDEVYHLFPQSCIYLGLGWGIGESAFNGTAVWLGIAGMLAAMFNRVAPKLEVLIRFYEADMTEGNKNGGDIESRKSHPIGIWLGLITRFDWVILMIVIATILEMIIVSKVDFIFIVFTLLVVANILRMIIIISGVGRRLL